MGELEERRFLKLTIMDLMSVPACICDKLQNMPAEQFKNVELTSLLYKLVIPTSEEL